MTECLCPNAVVKVATLRNDLIRGLSHALTWQGQESICLMNIA